jgi:coproporphyrinogen III oxidase
MRNRAQQAVEDLQDHICTALETVDGSGRFQEDRWTRAEGGGGKTRIMTDGDTFEKAGVNTSAVHGSLPPALAKSLKGDGDSFFATGVSLVIHPKNPHIPTTHANFRYIERGDTFWFGGGADLTPYVLYDEDAVHFHQSLADACDAHDPAFYPRFKKWCDDYFHLPHRKEARGIGGIFFDYVVPDSDHDAEALFSWWSDISHAFVPAYTPIVERRRDTPYDTALRNWQLGRRGRYVEFNLLYDRGTLFGLKTDGRIESILMSLPPLVRWDYNVVPEPGSPEDTLIRALSSPQNWLGRTAPLEADND